MRSAAKWPPSSTADCISIIATLSVGINGYSHDVYMELQLHFFVLNRNEYIFSRLISSRMVQLACLELHVQLAYGASQSCLHKV